MADNKEKAGIWGRWKQLFAAKPITPPEGDGAKFADALASFVGAKTMTDYHTKQVDYRIRAPHYEANIMFGRKAMAKLEEFARMTKEFVNGKSESGVDERLVKVNEIVTSDYYQRFHNPSGMAVEIAGVMNEKRDIKRGADKPKPR